MFFGTDPEFFLTYKVGDKEYVYSPAALYKYNGFDFVNFDFKHPSLIEREDYKFIMDGAAMELNFRRPFNNPKEMYEAVKVAISDLKDFANKFGLGVSQKPLINFDFERFWSDENKEDSLFMQGIIFGCDEDKDAFNVDWLCKIVNAETHPYRYGGGHLHFSGDDLLKKYPIPAVKLCALFIGNYCIWKSLFPEEEKLRANYYGKPGKYRIQRYPNGEVGIEYRTPSNSWTNLSAEEFEKIFDMFNWVIYYLSKPKKGDELLKEFVDTTVDAITTANKELAYSNLKQMGVL